MAGCSGGGADVNDAAKDLVKAMAARNTAKVADLMDISEDDAALLIGGSFAGKSQEIRQLQISPAPEGCQTLTEEQTSRGVTAFCSVLADLQFKDPSNNEWTDLRLAFIVEVCNERAIVSVKNAGFQPKC
jgi:hypothetical protein